ncbi:MAG: Na(+)/H(+) antiporter subunit D [Betaproteobacteria bacterium]|nr:Na(+)/H(+) antiporter subunit D [Betaproteobacteria bacterium]MDH5219912.1 Na(+)/H(+) antiporter subunit D [Betaproteobacteria bacterium]MDH5349588.1 Na(+)/H(+) antiporter subunit D [Betaproteobacteria bacterium]
MIDLLHPGLLVVFAGVALALLRGPVRAAVALAAPLAALWIVLAAPAGPAWSGSWLGLDMRPLAYDALSRLFAVIFALMAFGGALFALNQKSRLELPAAFVYAGSAIGAVLAGDLVTLFVFWELMAVGSTLVLWSAGASAYRASMRYLAIHLLGGVLLFAGIAGHVAETGSTEFARMALDSPSHWLILAGFLVNAGAPPLSAWLPDAYPEASWSGMVFLSAFTTKTAVCVLLRGFPGTELLVWVGLFMVFYGIVYALLENDMRRILAYSIVNQVGFMVTGIGIGTEMALNGAAAHAFTHIIYKALLLMSAGSVLYATGKRKCTDLGGLFRTMPLTTVCGTIGALAISSFPLTSGFVSKSMISQAAGDEHLLWVWLALAAATAGVFLHAGIKFPWFVFFQKDSGLRPPEPPLNMRLAMLFFAALCIGLGVFYQPLYALLPFGTQYVPYTGAHVVVQLELLLFSGLAFFVMLPMLRRTLTITLDTDWVYRRMAPALVAAAEAGWRRAVHAIGRSRGSVLHRLDSAVQGLHGPQALFARTWSSGGMALWVALMLALYLLLGYL